MVLKSYNKYINEGVRDMMTPKSEKEIDTIMSSLTPKQKKSMLGDKLEDVCWNPESIEQVEEYLKLGADPNYNLNTEGRPTAWTPLRYAIVSYNIECIKLLIKYGANVNPLHIHEAERLPQDTLKEIKDRNEIIKILKSVEMNESVKDLMTPKSEVDIREDISKAPIPNQFIRACQYGYFDIVKKTLQPVKDSRDYLTLVYMGMRKSVAGGFLDIFKYLVDNTELNFLHWNDEELLRSAIENGYTDIVEYLYSLGANTPKWTEKSLRMDEGIRDMMTPKPEEEIKKSLEAKPPKSKISFGTANDIPWLVMQGIEEDKNIDVRDEDNYLLRWACEKGHIPLVKLLLDRGSDLHDQGDVALMNACYYNHPELVEFLLDKGANPEADRGYLLSGVAMKGYYKITELLLKSGAKKKIEQAIRMAKHNGYDDILELLNKYQSINESIRDKMTPKPEDDIINSLGDVGEYQKMKYGARYGILSLVRPILDRGVYMPTIMDDIFNIACKYGNINVVQYLLSLKNFNYVLHNYIEGFKNAVSGGHADVVELLLDIEPDIPIEDNHNWALRLAVSNGHLDLVKVLLDSGADIKDLKFSRGSIPNRTPIELMRDRGFNDLADYIEQYTQTNESVRDQMTPKSEMDILQKLNKKDTKKNLKMAIDENLVDLAYAIVHNSIDLDDSYTITYSLLANMINENDEMTPMLCDYFKRDLNEPFFQKVIEEREKFHELYKIVKQSKDKRVVDLGEPHVIKTIEQTYTPFLTSFFQFEITTQTETTYTRNIITVDFRLNMPELKSDWNFKYVIKWSKNRDNKEFLSWSLPTEQLKKFFKENIYHNFNLEL